MIFDYLEQMRHRPAAARQKAALLGAGIGTLVIILLWGGHLWLVNWTDQVADRDDRPSVIGTEWDRIKLGGQFIIGEIRSLIGKIK